MRDVFAAREAELEGYTDALRYAAGQKGMAVVVNGEVAGMDLLSQGPVFKELFPKLVRSYAWGTDGAPMGPVPLQCQEATRSFRNSLPSIQMRVMPEE